MTHTELINYYLQQYLLKGDTDMINAHINKSATNVSIDNISANNVAGISYTAYQGMPSMYTINQKMPSIVSHTFKNGRTTIKWSDGTMTQVACEPNKADMYTGFMIAVAKKAYGNNNTINNLADKWLFKIPKQKAEREAREKAEKIEQERIAANKARKREIYRKKKMIRDEARRIKEQYEREKLNTEAKKMAIEKFGVPADYVNN